MRLWTAPEFFSITRPDAASSESECEGYCMAGRSQDCVGEERTLVNRDNDALEEDFETAREEELRVQQEWLIR